MKKDPLEVDNKINDGSYQNEINSLRAFYKEFESYTPATGKNELIEQKMNKTQ